MRIFASHASSAKCCKIRKCGKCNTTGTGYPNENPQMRKIAQNVVGKLVVSCHQFLLGNPQLRKSEQKRGTRVLRKNPHLRKIPSIHSKNFARI
jgi:hypothetical protein